jgi:hypothetical protein
MSEESKPTSESTSDFKKEAQEKLTQLSNQAGEKINDVRGFFVSAPEKRAHASGRYLSRLSLSWGILSVIGAIIMMFQTECEDYSESYSYCRVDVTHPYVNWAIVSLLANLIIASFMYTIGTYIEARMAQELNK